MKINNHSLQSVNGLTLRESILWHEGLFRLKGRLKFCLIISIYKISLPEENEKEGRSEHEAEYDGAQADTAALAAPDNTVGMLSHEWCKYLKDRMSVKHPEETGLGPFKSNSN